MTHPTEIDLLNAYLRVILPQEWLVGKSEHTTCEETDTFSRIDSEPKPDNERKLVCLIQIKPDEIIIRTPDMQTSMVQKITRAVKKYCDALEDHCLTISECPLNCEKCKNSWSKFHE